MVSYKQIFSIVLQVFEVLHYLGSCLLKIVKAKVVKSGKKQRRISSSVYDREARDEDEDPHLATTKRQGVQLQDTAAGEGEAVRLTIYEAIHVSEYEPCLLNKNTSIEVQESVISKKVKLKDKSTETLQRKWSSHHENGNVEGFKSYQVKYTDSKQPNRYIFEISSHPNNDSVFVLRRLNI